MNKRKDKHLVELLKNNIKNDVLSIVNHNDAMSSLELNNITNATDNDKNAVELSKKIKLKRVIYLSNTNGLLDMNDNTITWWSIVDEFDKERYRKNIRIWERSKHWTGGGDSKLECCFDVLENSVWESIWANVSSGLSCLYENDNCTKFTKN